MNFLDLIIIFVLVMALSIGFKSCLWNIRPHNWINRGNVDICSKCGLIRNKVRK